MPCHEVPSKGILLMQAPIGIEYALILFYVVNKTLPLWSPCGCIRHYYIAKTFFFFLSLTHDAHYGYCPAL